MDKKPDNLSDSLADKDVRSKIAYFNDVNNTEQKEKDAQKRRPRLQRPVSVIEPSSSSGQVPGIRTKARSLYRPSSLSLEPKIFDDSIRPTISDQISSLYPPEHENISGVNFDQRSYLESSTQPNSNDGEEFATDLPLPSRIQPKLNNDHHSTTDDPITHFSLMIPKKLGEEQQSTSNKPKKHLQSVSPPTLNYELLTTTDDQIEQFSPPITVNDEHRTATKPSRSHFQSLDPQNVRKLDKKTTNDHRTQLHSHIPPNHDDDEQPTTNESTKLPPPVSPKPNAKELLTTKSSTTKLQWLDQQEINKRKQSNIIYQRQQSKSRGIPKFKCKRHSFTDDQTLHSKSSKLPIWTGKKLSAYDDLSKCCLKDMEIFQHPMCLISAESTKNDSNEVTEILLKKEVTAFEQLEKINMPLVVVAVVGLYRTGKSYLMNCLAESSPREGFALGDTIESKTKGIWIWCKIHPQMSNTVLVLIDTEGLGDVKKGDQRHDNKIFTLATLLCNCLVYNMKGTFDNDTVAKLTFVTELAKNIRFRGESSEDNQTLSMVLPDFVLCLRDFSLKLQTGERKLTEKEYLEECLADNTSKTKQFNKPLECIRKFFAKRECFTFPVPGDGNVLENLEQLSFNDLSDKFKEATSRFVAYIYSLKPKALPGSKPLNGQMFITLVDSYVSSIKNGAVPDVDDAFSAVAKIENEKIERKAVELFKNELTRVALPVSRNELKQTYTNTLRTTLKYLRENTVNDDNTYESQAQEKMDIIWNKIRETNDEKIKEVCKDILKHVKNTYIQGQIQSKAYEKKGGHRRFQRDIENLKVHYFQALRNFAENEILWTWYEFLNDLNGIEEAILQADENLTQREREDERKRYEENLYQLMRDQQRVHQEALDKHTQLIEHHYNMLVGDRLEHMETEIKRYEELVVERLSEKIAKKEIERNRLKHQEKKRRSLFGGAFGSFRNKKAIHTDV